MPRERLSIDHHKLAGTKPAYVEPQSDVDASRPRYPKGLTPEAKRVFKNVTRLLERRRSLTEADGELVRLLALTHVRHARAVEKLAEQGEIRIYVRLDSNGQPHDVEKENLWLAVATTAEKQMIGIYDRLGFTPRDRSKIRPTKEEPKPEDDASFFPSREPITPPDNDIDLNSIPTEVLQ
jgi:P27 family predicted phage terminase small subunit